MKKTAKVLIALLIAALLSCSACLADTDFDPASYTNDELREILRTISIYLAHQDEGATVLYDSDDVYIECRGLVPYYSSGVLLDLYIENNRDTEIRYNIYGVAVNKYSMQFANPTAVIQPGCAYLSSALGDDILFSYKFEPYEIETITSLEFKLSVKTADDVMLGEKTISLEMFYPLP